MYERTGNKIEKNGFAEVNIIVPVPTQHIDAEFSLGSHPKSMLYNFIRRMPFLETWKIHL